jgi:hypothetical protein
LKVLRESPGSSMGGFTRLLHRCKLLSMAPSHITCGFCILSLES